MASGPDSALGSLSLGWTASRGAGPARCLIPAQLAAVSGPAAEWLDPAIVSALVFRADPFSSRAVLLLAVPRPQAIACGFPDLRSGLRSGRFYGYQQLAANAERGVVGAARPAVLSACH